VMLPSKPKKRPQDRDRITDRFSIWVPWLSIQRGHWKTVIEYKLTAWYA